jgi:hypothetical protein
MRIWLAELVSGGWRFAQTRAAAVAAVVAFVTVGASAALAQPEACLPL